MQARLGAKVWSPEGELGTIDGLVPTRDLDRFEDFIVRQGKLVTHELQVPLSHIASVDQDGVIHLRSDQPSAEESKPVTQEGYRAPDVDWNAPPAATDVYPVSGEFEVDATLSRGAVGFDSGKAGGYPAGEQIVPDDQQLPVIRRGTPVLDISGEQVGEVGEILVNVEDGTVAHFMVRSGFLFKHDRELSPATIRELAGDGVVLNLARGELENGEAAA